MVAAQDYYPYGEFIRQVNHSAGLDKYKFTGKERDAGETNLDYFGARYYNSTLGLWLSVDPLAGKYPGWSSYNYCLDNPLKFIDMHGDSAWSVTRGWDELDKEAFALFYDKKSQEYVNTGTPIDCANLQYSILIDYASQNGLPLELNSSDGKTTFDSNSDSYSNVDKFKKDVNADLGSQDIKENTFALNRSEKQSGDMALFTSPWHHVVGFTRNNKVVYGNLYTNGNPMAPVIKPDWTLIRNYQGKQVVSYPDRNHVLRWSVLNKK